MNNYETQRSGKPAGECGGSCSNAKYLFCYFPTSITLTANVLIGGGTTQLRFADACGLFDDLGIGTAVTVQQFDVRGAVAANTVRNYLQTHMGRVKMINYSCPLQAAQLNNRIQFFNATIDEQQGISKLFDVSVDQRNTQEIQTLQTVFPHEGDAYMMNTSGILVNTDDVITKDVELTIQFDKWEMYRDIHCGPRM